MKKIKSLKIIDPGTAPDVDTDITPEGRGEMIKYVQSKYGTEDVATIFTPGPFKARNSFKSMATVFGVPFGTSNKISTALPPSTEKATVEDYLNEKNKEGEEFRSLLVNDTLKEVAESAAAINGRLRETGTHACFTGDTYITTSTGYKKIKDVKIGELVLTHKNRYKPVVDVMKNPPSNGVKILTSNSTFTKVTSNHKFLVRSISGENGKRFLTEPYWKSASDLIKGEDFIGLPINQSNEMPQLYSSLPIEEEDFWWVVGRFLGDGWLENNNINRKETFFTKENISNIIISVEKNDITYTELKEKVSRLFNYKISTNKTTDKFYLKFSGILFAFFKEFGNKVYEKQVPEFVQNLPKNLLKSFLAGYLSSSRVNTKSYKDYSYLSFSKKLTLGISRIINKVYYTPSDNRLVRDYYVSDFQTKYSPSQKSFSMGDYIWSSIEKIDKIKIDEPVYNLTVLDDSSYLANNLTAHNCGVIISSRPIYETIPTELRERDDLLITQWDYHVCESLGLIKMDFLGLETIELNQLANSFVKKTTGKEVDLKALIHGSLDDEKTFELFRNADTTGIFQFSGAGVREMLKEVKPNRFDDLPAITALYRPGPMAMNAHKDFAERKNNPKLRVPANEPSFIGTAVEEILEPTYGLICYQESVMTLAKRCAGFTAREADDLRKAIGKKKMDLMISLGDKFKSGMIENGYQKQAVENLWNGIVAFGSYAFNKSHSVSYALLAYQSAYLKAHYRTEFMCAVARLRQGKDEKFKPVLAEIRKRGIKILPASVNSSSTDLEPSTLEKNTIVFGFGAIKGLSGEIGKAIQEEREANGLFKNLADFIKRMIPKGLTKGSLITLAQVGAFDDMGLSRKAIVDNAQKLFNLGKKKAEKASQPTLFGNLLAEHPTFFDLPKDDYSYADSAKLEADLTGFFLSHSPLDKIKQIKEYDLENLEISSDIVFYTTFAKIKSITTKSKFKMLLAMVDNGISQEVFKFSNDIYKSFQKYNTLQGIIQEFDGIDKVEQIDFHKDRIGIYKKAIQILGIKSRDEFNQWLKLPAIPYPETNVVYKVCLGYTSRNWNNNKGRIEIKSIERTSLSDNGKLVHIIQAKDKRRESLYIKKLRENSGSDVVRLVYLDKTYTDVENIKFLPGTSQYDINKIDSL